MAGLTQEKIIYLKVTCGRMICKKEGVITHDYSGYEGIFLGIREKKGEFEGQPTISIEVKMKDTKSEEIVIIQFTKKALFAKGFFQTIRKVNLDAPFTICVWGSDTNEKISFCGLKQEGYKYIDNRKTIEPDKSFPNYMEIPVGDGKVQDWTLPLAEMDKIIKDITERRTTRIKEMATEISDVENVPQTAIVDDLPF